MVKLTHTHLLRGIINLLKRCYDIARPKLKRIALLMFFDPYCDYLVRKSLKLNKTLGFNGEISGKRVTTDRFWEALIHFEESTGCFLVSNISEAAVAMMFGTAYSPRRCMYLRSVVKRKLPFVIAEDGFIRSVMPFSTKLSGTQSDEKTHGLSYIVDHKGVYIDAEKGSIINDFLNSDWQMTNEEKKPTTNAMAYIKKKSLSKYNVVKPKIINFNTNNKYSSVILVVDQSKGDKSVSGAKANNRSFQRMLHDAINKSPDSLILIKTHPDETLGGRRGYFTSYSPQRNNIRMLHENLNPISLLQAVDKVYVVSSQMGIEALLCEKEVVCYGIPFYSGWGLTTDRGTGSSERHKKRTLEELFYAAYLKFTYYFNPATGKKSNLHGVLRYLAAKLENQP